VNRLLPRKPGAPRRYIPAFLLAAALILANAPSAPAQLAPVVVGLVTDPSGALVADATVTFHPLQPPAPDKTVVTTRTGRYRISPSDCCVQFQIFVTAAGFAAFDSGPMRFRSDEAITLDIHLKISAQAEEVNVNEDSTSSTDPNRNGDAIVLKGRAIDDLPLDSTELMQELEGLSGGPAPDIYVDGFSGGTLPPRDTIREIRINQNPYSAQNDTNPTNGQIQIFTKPGANKLHGDFYIYANDSAFNTLNPFVTIQPPYYNVFANGSISGPINKHASFFANANREDSQTDSIINAQTLDANNNQITVQQAISTPSSGYYFSTRFDLAPSKNSTLTLRYSDSEGQSDNAGIGALNLITQAYQHHSVQQIFQASNSQIVSPKIVYDSRFQYTRSRVTQTPADNSPTLSVEGAFTGGGSNGGSYNDNQDRYELQNYFAASEGKHYFNFGMRFRATRDANHSNANYNGTYTFASLAQYQATLQGVAGAGPSQFSIATGNPNVAVEVNDTALFFQDDWKARPNLTISGGLRFETQNVISNKADFAPRFGFAWGLKTKKDKPALYTLRGGAGIFYTRFTSGYVLQAARQNGITQQEYIAASPACFPVCSAANASAQASSTIYQISPTFHAPYYVSGTLSLERQINTWGSVTLSYLSNRGVHIQLTRNINAPLPGTYNPLVPTSGTRPLGGNQNIYEYDSIGLWRQNRLTTNFFLHFKNNRFILYGYYQLRHDTTDASGGAFPSNQYDIGVDQGPSTGDTRHSFYAGTGAQLPFNFHTYIFARAQSGNPFNITVGQDLNGDSIFNDRPAFATDLTRASVVKTQYGNFDTSPITGQTIIPIDYGHGPGLFLVNVQLSREFHFGPEIKRPAGAPAPKLAAGQKPPINRRYSIEFGVDAQNVFNQVNLAPPIATLNSPLFGRSIALANSGSNSSANRLINLSSYFHF
jgi:hypothetical protein